MKVEILGTEEENEKVINFCIKNKIAYGVFGSSKTKTINLDNVLESKRIKPAFIEGKKSAPIYESLVDKYGKVEADRILAEANKIFIGKSN
ncbi:hypothetical protein [Tenacibaculum ovolyticum]|uniref:hypothetical protein n=1 Tax=Tenacibaculum ovolyticum TaxID=104270 RepID=UPI0007ED6C7A|nr:hypothetical protein [Tenacibaculum ovolyticum]